MAMTIDQAFIKQFEADVHMAYQRQGSKLRNTVRTKSGVRGSSTTFQKVGTGAAVQKARHAQVATMNIAHTNVECTLQDWYASDWIDKLDEIKTNIDERMVIANNAAYALGRKTDDMIVTQLDTTSNAVTEAGNDGLTQAKINTVFNYFGNNDVPDDGDRFWVISPSAWTNLLSIQAFSSADYIGQEQLPYQGGMVAKRWLGFMWFTHSGLPIASTIRKTFAYHRSAVGHAVGQDVTTEMNYVPTNVAHLATSFMSMGAVLIDEKGSYEVQIKE